MSRRLPDLPYGAPNALIVGGLLGVVGMTLALYVVVDRTEPARPAVTGVDCWDEPSCAATAAGYVVLDPQVAPDLADYVYVGPMSWEEQGATVSVPGLVEDIADGCADQPDDLLDCVGAVVGQRMEHRP